MKRNQTATAGTPAPKKANIYLIGTIAAIAGLLFGFDTGVISGAQEFIFKTFELKNDAGLASEATRGFVVSAVPLGALLGALMSGFFARTLGRKRSILFTAIVFLGGTLCAAFAPNLESVVLGRLLMGLAIGISAMVAPMYLSEVSPPQVRGTIIFMFQLAITLGLLAAFAIHLWFSHSIQDFTMNWRWMFGVGVVPALILFFGMLFMPCSPRWLHLKGRVNEAQKVLQNLLGKSDVSKEMAEIKVSVQGEGRSGSFLQLFKKPLLPLLAVSFGLFVFQQLSGINAIMYYGPQVFAKAGFGESTKYLAQFFMGLTNVVATLFGVWVVDKIGRRPLLSIGFIGMIACLGILGFLLKSGSGEYPFLALASILLFIVFFAISLGGVPYIMMSEVFPLKARASGMAIASCANWGFNMLVSFSFGILVTAMGNMGNVFMLYASCTMVGFIFAWYMVPETKNRQLEELEQNLYAGKPVRRLGDQISRPADV